MTWQLNDFMRQRAYNGLPDNYSHDPNPKGELLFSLGIHDLVLSLAIQYHTYSRLMEVALGSFDLNKCNMDSKGNAYLSFQDFEMDCNGTTIWFTGFSFSSLNRITVHWKETGAYEDINRSLCMEDYWASRCYDYSQTGYEVIGQLLDLSNVRRDRLCFTTLRDIVQSYIHEPDNSEVGEALATVCFHTTGKPAKWDSLDHYTKKRTLQFISKLSHEERTNINVLTHRDAFFKTKFKPLIEWLLSHPNLTMDPHNNFHAHGEPILIRKDARSYTLTSIETNHEGYDRFNVHFECLLSKDNVSMVIGNALGWGDSFHPMSVKHDLHTLVCLPGITDLIGEDKYFPYGEIKKPVVCNHHVWATSVIGDLRTILGVQDHYTLNGTVVYGNEHDYSYTANPSLWK